MNMSGTIELKTKRLILRRHIPADADVLFEMLGTDPKMFEYSGWNPYKTREMAKKTIDSFIGSYSDPHFYGWGIEKDGRLIGTVGAYDFDPAGSRIEAGMSVERQSWGCGYATDALSAVLEYLTKHEQIRTVSAWCASDNAASLKVMQKSGMKLKSTEPGALEINGIRYDKLILEYSMDPN